MLAKSLEPEGLNRGLSVQSELGKGSEFSFVIQDQNKDLQIIINEEVKEEDN